MFSPLLFGEFKLKTEGKSIYRKPHYKITTQIKIFAHLLDLLASFREH